MWKVNALFATVLISLLGCSQGGESLSIEVAENAGFEKDQQKIFQMVGAQDGWSGDWAGDRVELYQFSDPTSVNAETFKASVHPDNISGWVEMCVVRNILMLSKGKNACRNWKAWRNEA